jgi:hypothetical protein
MTEKMVAAKLHIKEGYAVHLLGTPDAAQLLGELPANAHLVAEPADADAAVVFVANGAELERQLGGSLASLTAAKVVWVAYPKGNKADINRDVIRERMASAGWEVVSNVAIDAVWSALRAKPVR